MSDIDTDSDSDYKKNSYDYSDSDDDDDEGTGRILMTNEEIDEILKKYEQPGQTYNVEGRQYSAEELSKLRELRESRKKSINSIIASNRFQKKKKNYKKQQH
jgi:hypothetical protein